MECVVWQIVVLHIPITLYLSEPSLTHMSVFVFRLLLIRVREHPYMKCGNSEPSNLTPILQSQN